MKRFYKSASVGAVDGEFEEGALPRVGTENGGVPRQWDRP